LDILITGFMGAGKTTLIEGYRKNSLGFSIYDLDKEIASSLGIAASSLGEWIEKNGLPSLRLKEKETLQLLLSEKKSKVIALGGGTPAEPWFDEVKGEALVVFLDTPIWVCLERIKSDSNRPMVRLGEEGLKNLYIQRLPTYKKADFICTLEEIKGIEALESLVHTLKDY
jgi:shikimate kinase